MKSHEKNQHAWRDDRRWSKAPTCPRLRLRLLRHLCARAPCLRTIKGIETPVRWRPRRVHRWWVAFVLECPRQTFRYLYRIYDGNRNGWQARSSQGIFTTVLPESRCSMLVFVLPPRRKTRTARQAPYANNKYSYFYIILRVLYF